MVHHTFEHCHMAVELFFQHYSHPGKHMALLGKQPDPRNIYGPLRYRLHPSFTSLLPEPPFPPLVCVLQVYFIWEAVLSCKRTYVSQLRESSLVTEMES